jgi:hypothetical protein
VWQASHLDIPPPGELPYKQILRRLGWSILAIIAPKMVALNAWLQYCEARNLKNVVNYYHGLYPEQQSRTWPRRLVDCVSWLFSELCMLFMSAILIVDRLRMFIFHYHDFHTFGAERRRLRINDVVSLLDRDQLPWDTSTAFYPLRRGGILLMDDRIRVFGRVDILELAEMDPKCPLPFSERCYKIPARPADLLSSSLAPRLCGSALNALHVLARIWQDPCSSSTPLLIASVRSSFMSSGGTSRMTLRHTSTSCQLGLMFSQIIDSTYLTLEAGTWLERCSAQGAGQAIACPGHWFMVLTFLVYEAMHSLAWQYHFSHMLRRLHGDVLLSRLLRPA